MRNLTITARSHWRRFLWAWAFPFFLVFIYIPLEKALPSYRWPLWFFFGLPVFFISFILASAPLRNRDAPLSHGILLVGFVPLVLMLVALALRDGILFLFR